MKAYPTPFQAKTVWTALAFLGIVVTGALSVGAVWLTSFILGYLQPVLVPLAIAGIIAYLLDPIIGKLTARGLTHTKAMLIVFCGFMASMALLAVVVLVPAIQKGSDLYGERENYRVRVVEQFEKLEERVNVMVGNSPDASRYWSQGAEWLTNSAPNIAKKMGGWFWNRVQGVFGFLGYAVGLLLVPIYLFYFLKESHSITENWADYLPLRASEFKDEVVATLSEINGYLIAFFRGQMLVSMIDGILVGIGLSLIGLPYAPVIGVFVALLGLIPYIGNLLCLIPAILIAIAHFGAEERVTITAKDLEVGQVITAPAAPRALPTYEEATVESSAEEGTLATTTAPVEVGKEVTGVISTISEDGKTAKVLTKVWSWLPYPWVYPVIVFLLFTILQQINSLVTAPKIVGDSVGLHPLTVIFSVLFWSLLLGGLLGALLAVPLTAAIKVLLRRYVWEARLKSETVGGAAQAQ